MLTEVIAFFAGRAVGRDPEGTWRSVGVALIGFFVFLLILVVVTLQLDYMDYAQRGVGSFWTWATSCTNASPYVTFISEWACDVSKAAKFVFIVIPAGVLAAVLGVAALFGLTRTVVAFVGWFAHKRHR